MNYVNQITSCHLGLSPICLYFLVQDCKCIDSLYMCFFGGGPNGLKRTTSYDGQGFANQPKKGGLGIKPLKSFNLKLLEVKRWENKLFGSNKKHYWNKNGWCLRFIAYN
eukprot:TRINITY_DN9094_c0_g2_i1.p1 TRINITY_DN9094_c0_g2~~TRINITY_DN9094_c0_g2_i1.p1  ORF type:complete len:109 (-),score=7.41 TRINITY_DN9094_c0_g2_i1:2892-3218(-)